MSSKTNEQSVVKERSKIDILKKEYMDTLQKIIDNKNNNQIIDISALTNCQIIGNKFFNHIETFVGNSGLLGAHDNLQWITGFAEDCYAHLESIIIHYNFLRSYIDVFNNHGVQNIDPSQQSYANMQRLVMEYLPVSTVSKLRDNFINNNLPIYGFDMPIKDNNKISKFQTITGLIIGIILLISSVFIAILIPSPSTWQEFVFRGTFSLSLALIAPIIPGFVKMTTKIKILNSYTMIVAGSSIAIFLIIWFFNPGKF
jgi:hypothetical protein